MKKKTDKNPLNTFQLFTFCKPASLQKHLHGRATIHPGILLGRALWADSVPSRMNTIASRDQFKPIRIGENLVVNYHA